MNSYLLLRQIRFSTGKNQTEFGKDMRVGLQEVSKWERNIVSIPNGKLFRLYWLCINKYNEQRFAMECIKELNRRMK